MPIQVVELNHVALPVSDLRVSRQFYGNILGFEELERPKFSFAGAWYRLGASQELHLLARSSAALNVRGSIDRHFALRVSELEQLLLVLDKFRVPHRPPKQRPDGIWQVFVRDPDEHTIEFFCE